MIRCLSTPVLCAGAFALAIASEASGGITYATDAAQYVVAPNAKITVHIYLDFTGSDAANLLLENGLFGTGTTLTVTQSVPNNNPAIVVDIADIVHNQATFDDPLGAVKSFTASSASFLATVDPYANDGDLGAVGTVVGSGRRIELGTITFTAGAIPGESTTFTAGDFDPATDDTVTWHSFQTLDSQIGFATITIQTEGDYCPADFTLDGYVDTDDFTAFVLAFILGGDNADFDKSGFVDTDDFTAFTLAFEAGC